ncbi:bicoid stability factor [Andrena cerasifolii]|uniref:bicoid stability factor n=1 Tax=Andrena cerasifolii TaxID=2819439 RepID=UPI004037E53A
MISTLLQRVKHFRHLPGSLVLNQNKVLTKFVIQWYNSSFVILTRNMLVTPNIEERTEGRLKLFTKMKTIDRNMLAHGWIKKSEIENVLCNINSADDIHKFQAVLLLLWCNNVMDCLPLERLKLGEYLWSHLSVCNVPMDSSHYNALLQLYLKNDRDFSPIELLTEMKSKRICPDDVTYRRCIQYYCEKGNVLEALELAKQLKQLNFPTSIDIYNSLIVGYSQLHDLKSISKILLNIIESKIKPNAETFTAVMCAYAKKNNIDGIKEQIYTCKSSNIHLSNENIFNVIYTLAANNYTQHIDTMYRYIKKSSVLSSDEIRLLLKLLYINQVDTVVNILSHIRPGKIVPLVLENLVYCSTNVDKIIYTCSIIEKRQMHTNPLLSAVYYSFLKDDDALCLPLLRACKLRYSIKPHYFWPLLLKKANAYDFKGILEILSIMRSDFNTTPCIDTVTDYVLPFSFGKIFDLRRVLMGSGICETTINNAYVLSYLKKNRTKNALYYMHSYGGYYSYKVIQHDLRSALIMSNDAVSFVAISSKLATNPRTDLETSFNAETYRTAVLVPMDRQLIDFMANCPEHKTYLVKIIIQLAKADISISPQTADRLHLFIKEYATTDVTRALQNVSNKRRNLRAS